MVGRLSCRLTHILHHIHRPQPLPAFIAVSDIKMFAPDGTYLKTLGKEGQGPGEFGRMGTMTLAGEHLVINDSRNGRFSVWTLQGDHVADHVPSGRGFISSMQGLADGPSSAIAPSVTRTELAIRS